MPPVAISQTGQPLLLPTCLWHLAGLPINAILPNGPGLQTVFFFEAGGLALAYFYFGSVFQLNQQGVAEIGRDGFDKGCMDDLLAVCPEKGG